MAKEFFAKEKEAHEKLVALVAAAEDLHNVWRKLKPFDILSETCPDDFPEVDIFVRDIQQWEREVRETLEFLEQERKP